MKEIRPTLAAAGIGSSKKTVYGLWDVSTESTTIVFQTRQIFNLKTHVNHKRWILMHNMDWEVCDQQR